MCRDRVELFLDSVDELESENIVYSQSREVGAGTFDCSSAAKCIWNKFSAKNKSLNTYGMNTSSQMIEKAHSNSSLTIIGQTKQKVGSNTYTGFETKIGSTIAYQGSSGGHVFIMVDPANCIAFNVSVDHDSSKSSYQGYVDKANKNDSSKLIKIKGCSNGFVYAFNKTNSGNGHFFGAKSAPGGDIVSSIVNFIPTSLDECLKKVADDHCEDCKPSLRGHETSNIDNLSTNIENIISNSGSKSYKVKAGDTMYSLSRKFGFKKTEDFMNEVGKKSNNLSAGELLIFKSAESSVDPEKDDSWMNRPIGIASNSRKPSESPSKVYVSGVEFDEVIPDTLADGLTQNASNCSKMCINSYLGVCVRESSRSQTRSQKYSLCVRTDSDRFLFVDEREL